MHELDPSDRVQSASELNQILSQSLAHVQNPNEHKLPESLSKKRRFTTSWIVIAVAFITISVCLLPATQGWLTVSEPNNANDVDQTIQPTEKAPIQGPNKQSDIDDWDDGLDSVVRELRLRIEAFENEQDNYDEN